MERLTLQVGTFEVNCSLLFQDRKALIVDPGQEPERIIAALEAKNAEPVAVLLTHGHFDHIGAIPGLQTRYPGLAVFVTAEDAEVMVNPLNQYTDYPPVAAPANRRGPEELAAVLSAAGLPVPEVISAPGHTPGGVCYLFRGAEKGADLLFSGDTLFAGSVGRTDLPGGDMGTLMNSLDRLRKLRPETVVIPGHGMFTTIARELAGNPFLQ